MSTWNRLDLESIGSQPVMPKNLPDHYRRPNSPQHMILKGRIMKLSSSDHRPTFYAHGRPFGLHWAPMQTKCGPWAQNVGPYLEPISHIQWSSNWFPITMQLNFRICSIDSLIATMIITLFTCITMLRGSDNIPRNYLHIQPE